MTYLGSPGTPDSHATVTASIAAGDTYGVARKSKMLICAPKKATMNTHMYNLERILAHRQSAGNKSLPAVLNCSWGDSKNLPNYSKDTSSLLIAALNKVEENNIILVASAGNNSVRLGLKFALLYALICDPSL